MSEWRDIETAPKDGTFMVATKNGFVCPEVENWLDTEFECFFSDRYGRIYNPTHWQPLPEPPK